MCLWIVSGFQADLIVNFLVTYPQVMKHPLGSTLVYQVYPSWVQDIDPLDVYLDDERLAPPNRPYLLINMIASLDGASTIKGLSGDLANAADRQVLLALRACCDWILVGAGTANAERYRSPRTNTATSQRRLQLGFDATPRLAIVTASGNVDPNAPALRHSSNPPTLIICGQKANHQHLADLNAEVVCLPTPQPAPQEVLGALHERNAKVVLCEGGPRWNASLLHTDLIDEICVSISPILVGGTSARIITNTQDSLPTNMGLDRLLVEDDYLFTRYTRRVKAHSVTP